MYFMMSFPGGFSDWDTADSCLAEEWDVSVVFMFLSTDLCFSIGKVLLCHLLSPTTSAASYFVHSY